MAPAPIKDPALKKMLKLVNSFMNRNDSGPFREPVDWRGLELYDYPKIIKKFSDLGTVKRKLERHQYKNHRECANDIRLIWTNCCTYNAENSDFWLLAKAFSRRFEDKYKKIRNEFGDPEESAGEEEIDEDEEEEASDGEEDKKPAARGAKRRASPAASSVTSVNLDAKARFSSGLFLLSGIELAHVITTIELQCPHALEQVYGNSMQEHVEINVDALDNDTFAALDSYVHQKVGASVRKIAARPDDPASARDRKKRRR